jgi:hypothetical protein
MRTPLSIRIASQIILYASSFVVLLIIGNLLDTAFWQARFHAQNLLGSKPLPALSQFLHLTPPSAGSSDLAALAGTYWRAASCTLDDSENLEPQSFAFRHLAFLSTELFFVHRAVARTHTPSAPKFSSGRGQEFWCAVWSWESDGPIQPAY